MTSTTITCVVENIPVADPKDILDLVSGIPAILPAGNTITEIEVKLTGSLLINPATFYIGLFAPTSEFTTTYAFNATHINTHNYTGSVLSVEFPNQEVAVNANTRIQIQATGANDDIIGKLYIVVKYKPISIGKKQY